MLLEHGADIDAGNGVGLTPIMFAPEFGRGKVVGQLQAPGASLQRRNRLRVSAKWMVRHSQFITRLLREPTPVATR